MTLTVLNCEKSVRSFIRSVKKLSSSAVADLITVPTGTPSGNMDEYPLVMIVSPVCYTGCFGSSSRSASSEFLPSHTSDPNTSLPFSLHDSLKSGFSSDIIRL